MKDDLIVVRHARSEWNIGASKNMDSSITDFGIDQAKIVGKYIANGGPQCEHSGGRLWDIESFTFYVSPFLRCLMTMDYIIGAAGLNVRPVVLPQLGEFLFPDWVLKNGPVVIPLREEDYPHFDWTIYNSPKTYSSEISDIFLQRMQHVYDTLHTKSFVVTHGFPVMALAKEAMERQDSVPMWDYSISNCSLTWIRKGRKKWWGRILHHEVEYQDQPKKAS